jgi:hypothetical protein
VTDDPLPDRGWRAGRTEVRRNPAGHGAWPGRPAQPRPPRPGGGEAACHGTAADAPASPEIRIDGTLASITDGRIRAELKVVPRQGADHPKEVVIRYADTVTGQELLAETHSHFAHPGPSAFNPIASASIQMEATLG